jgi:predicted secreted Zn-dependent protease
MVSILMASAMAKAECIITTGKRYATASGQMIADKDKGLSLTTRVLYLGATSVLIKWKVNLLTSKH